MSKKEHFLLTEKYRPQTIEACILPTRLKTLFNDIVEKKDLPTMLFSGSSGVGKTTVAKAIAREIDSDILVINGSESGNIDTLRTTVRQFVSTSSFSDAPKIVLIDEADYLNRQSTQPALRNFIEEFSLSSRFIFTVNYPERIFKELVSRMVTVDFTLTKDDIREVIGLWDKRVKEILTNENIEYTDKVVAQVIKRYFPDYRKTLNEIQRYSVTGTLDISIMQTVSSDDIDVLIKHLREKSFTNCRIWCAQNSTMPFNTLASELWKRVDRFVEKQSIPSFVLHTNNYAQSSSIVLNQEINMLAYLTDLMAELEFKL